MERFLAGAPPRLPTPGELREAFLWAEHRQVTKTGMVSLFGNRYQVDPALVGATVELVFDPFDLAKIEVRYQQRPMGQAVPFQLDRHVHPAAKPDPAATGQAAPRPSGIDYLAMVEQRIAATQRRRIAYASLPELPAPNPGTGLGAGTHDHAATVDPSGSSPNDLTQVETTVGPLGIQLGVQLHLPATITPDPADDQAAGGATTTPPPTSSPPTPQRRKGRTPRDRAAPCPLRLRPHPLRP
jgi:hypothetical protein